MEKIKFVDKEFWKYFWLCVKVSGREWLIHFEGWKKVTEPIGVALTTTILTLVSQRLFNGALKMSDINIAIISVIGAPIVWSIFVYLLKLIFAPFRVYKQQNKELKKHSLDGVYFSLVEYDIPHEKGYAIRVENANDFDLDETLIEVKQVMIDDMFVMHTDNRKTCYLLKSIKEMDGLVKNKIVGSWHARDNPIQNGKHKDFVLTINKNGFSCELESHPLNLDIFDNGHLEDYRDKAFPVLFQLEFRATTNINGEQLVFPFKTLYVQENENGVFEWAKPEFWQ